MEPAPQTFGAYLKSFFKNLWQILKHPLALFPTIIITGVWILLGIMQTRYGESQTLSIFNFLTFAQGGLFGGLVGAIGGILGKILIATLLNAILLPIFVKGAKPLAKFGSGFKGFFRSFAFNGLRAIGAFLAGLAVALAIYSVLNITQRWQEGMVGIAAALLLIRTIGQKSGLLFSLFYSIVKAFSKKNTLPTSAGVSRFISGMSTGFIAGTCLNAFGLKWAVFISLCAFGLAFLCLLFGKRKRAALVAACIAAMLLVPVYAGPAPQKQVSEEVMRAAEEVRRLNAELNAAAARGDVAAGEKLDKQLKAAMDRYTRALAADNGSNSSNGSNNKSGNNKSGSGPSESSTNPFTGSHITDDGGGITVDDKNTVSDDNIPTRDAVVNVDFLKDDSPQDSGSKSGSSGADDDKGEYTLDDIINIIKKASTEGWAGEDGRIGDERTVEFLCILTGGLAAGSAGAAAGGAAGGPFGGGTDPLGSDLDWTVKKPGKKDDEEDENFYYNGDEEEEETASDEDEDYEEEEETEEDEEESEEEEETEDNEEEEEEEEEPVIKKPEEKKPEDKEPEEPEEQEDKEPEEKEPEKPADKGPEKPVDKEPEKVPDKEPEKDLDKEAEERDRAHKLDAWQQYAQKRGVDLTDDKGNQKSLEQLKQDITFMIKRDLQRANGQMQDAIQEELNSTLNLINAEYTDRACEMSVNMLAEVVDGGKVVKDMRDLVKAPFVGAMEAHFEGRSVWRGAAGGMADGALTVWQNHVGDHLGGMTGVKKFVAEGAGTIALEGGRKIANDAIAGKLSWDSLDEATNNMGKKTFEYGVGKLLVGSDQGEDGAMVATEGIMKLHDEAGITSGKTISQGFMDKIKDVRDKDIAGTLLYWTGLY